MVDEKDILENDDDELPDLQCKEYINHFKPTKEDWEKFREAIKRVDGMKEPHWCPIMGDSSYHYQDPGPTKFKDFKWLGEYLYFEFEDARIILMPIRYFPIIKDANHEEVSRFEFSYDKEVVEFPLLNTEIHVSQITGCKYKRIYP